MTVMTVALVFVVSFLLASKAFLRSHSCRARRRRTQLFVLPFEEYKQVARGLLGENFDDGTASNVAAELMRKDFDFEKSALVAEAEKKTAALVAEAEKKTAALVVEAEMKTTELKVKATAREALNLKQLSSLSQRQVQGLLLYPGNSLNV